jgi:hypothetical protein
MIPRLIKAAAVPDASLTQANAPLDKAGTTVWLGRKAVILAPLALAVVLFGLNNMAVLSGWMNPPEGYAPLLLTRSGDVAQYLTWMRAFQSQMTIPNYHTPWYTEPALFNPLLWMSAQLCYYLGMRLEVGYLLLQLLFYVIAAYSLVSALGAFMKTANQVYAALLIMFCSVPLETLKQIPRLVLGRNAGLPGMEDFVWWSSDGFFHGISGSLLVTAGTATTLMAFGLLAKYFDTNIKKYLVYASIVTFCSAIIHPFEVFVIVSAGVIALLWRSGREWRTAVPDISILGFAGLLGIAPYVLQVLGHQWLRDLAGLNRWSPGSPFRVLVMLGLPTILALGFLLTKPRLTAKTDALLLSWVGCALIGIYVPWLPWSQHLLDGFHYAVAMLLVRQAAQNNLVGWISSAYPRLFKTSLVAWLVLSLTAYTTFYYRSFLDGRAGEPEFLLSAIAPRDELASISWMRNNARPDQLVLAPREHAAWFATVPMHSLASHYISSLSYADQKRQVEEFYEGRLNLKAARQMLSDYGVSYVVMPEGSPAIDYLAEREKRVKFGSLVIYELIGHTMKPYPGLRREVKITD